MEYYLKGIPDEMWRRAKRVAIDHGTTLRELLLRGLREQLQKLEEHEPVPRVNINNIKRIFSSWDQLKEWAYNHETSEPLAYALTITAFNIDDLEAMWQEHEDPERVIMLAERIMEQFSGYTSESTLVWGTQGVVNE